MSTKFVANSGEVYKTKEHAVTMLKGGGASAETYYDQEQPHVTSSMEMMYYLSLCHVYSGEMEY